MRRTTATSLVIALALLFLPQISATQTHACCKAAKACHRKAHQHDGSGGKSGTPAKTCGKCFCLGGVISFSLPGTQSRIAIDTQTDPLVCRTPLTSSSSSTYSLAGRSPPLGFFSIA